MVLDKKMPQGQINIKHELFFFLFSTQINISRKTGGKYVVHWIGSDITGAGKPSYGKMKKETHT